jgi:hypothetical protein
VVCACAAAEVAIVFAIVCKSDKGGLAPIA